MAKKRTAELRDHAQGFGLLSDPTRLGILMELADGPKNVTPLCKALGLKQTRVSHHLGLLRMGGLVTRVRQGRSVLYNADKGALKKLQSALGALKP